MTTNRLKLFCWGLCFLCNSLYYSQERKAYFPIKLPIRVVNTNNTPIAYATIKTLPEKKYYYTDNTGKYNLTLKEKDDRIVVTAVGYLPDTFSIQNVHKYAKNKLILKRDVKVLPLVNIKHKKKIFKINYKKRMSGTWPLLDDHCSPYTLKHFPQLCEDDDIDTSYINEKNHIHSEICTYIQAKVPFTEGIISEINFFYECYNYKNEEKPNTSNDKELIVRIYEPEEDVTGYCNPLNLVPGKLLYTKRLKLPIIFKEKQVSIDLTKEYIPYTKKGVFISLEEIKVEDTSNILAIGIQDNRGFPLNPVFIKNNVANKWVNISKLHFFIQVTTKKKDVSQEGKVEEIIQNTFDEILKTKKYKKLRGYNHFFRLKVSY